MMPIVARQKVLRHLFILLVSFSDCSNYSLKRLEFREGKTEEADGYSFAFQYVFLHARGRWLFQLCTRSGFLFFYPYSKFSRRWHVLFPLCSLIWIRFISSLCLGLARLWIIQPAVEWGNFKPYTGRWCLVAKCSLLTCFLAWDCIVIFTAASLRSSVSFIDLKA